LCRRPRPRQSWQFADHRAAGAARVAHPAAGVGGTDPARSPRLHRHRGAARHFGGDAAEFIDRSRLPRRRAARRVAAGVLPRPDPGLRLLLSARLGAGAARAAGCFLRPPAAGHRLLSHRQPDRATARTLHGKPEAAHPAGANAGHFLAGADRAHDARLHARGAVVGFRAPRARQRPVVVHRDRHLRVPQRHAAGHHHARDGVLVPARRQRAGRESVRLARYRLLRGGGATRLRLRASAGFRADHGGDVCRAQPDDRRALRPDRSAREAGSMTDIAATPRREGGLAALFRHSRYILGENPVTGFAFALFVLIVIAAVLGPSIVPYDPLASDTTQAMKPPSAHHWFGTDQIGRDVFSRVIVATRLDFFIAVASVALVFLMGG